MTVQTTVRRLLQISCYSSFSVSLCLYFIFAILFSRCRTFEPFVFFLFGSKFQLLLFVCLFVLCFTGLFARQSESVCLSVISQSFKTQEAQLLTQSRQLLRSSVGQSVSLSV